MIHRPSTRSSSSSVGDPTSPIHPTTLTISRSEPRQHRITSVQRRLRTTSSRCAATMLRPSLHRRDNGTTKTRCSRPRAPGLGGGRSGTHVDRSPRSVCSARRCRRDRSIGGRGSCDRRRAARDGYDVGLIARGEVGLQAAADEVAACGRRALVLTADVAGANDVEGAALRVESELGDIDVWVNFAMTTIFAPVTTIDTAEFERATRVTYLGQVHGTLAALRRMRTRDRGVIVSVGSALAFRSIALQSAYCGAKFACRGFHDSVRVELRRDASAIRVCQVHLPALDTPQFGWCRNLLGRRPMPVPPIYDPAVAAEAIVGVVDRPRRERVVGVEPLDHPRQQGRARCARPFRGAHHV